MDCGVEVHTDAMNEQLEVWGLGNEECGMRACMGVLSE